MDGTIPELLGLSIKDIARICGVDLSTARRWKRGATYLPDAARKLLSRDLGHMDPAWAGWVLRRGVLISPEGLEATPGDVMAIQFTQAQLSAWRIEAHQLRKQVAELEGQMDEQPLPESWDIQSA